MVWKFCGKAQFPHSFGQFTRNYAETAFPQNFHTMKLGEITLFYAVLFIMENCNFSSSLKNRHVADALDICQDSEHGCAL